MRELDGHDAVSPPRVGLLPTAEKPPRHSIDNAYRRQLVAQAFGLGGRVKVLSDDAKYGRPNHTTTMLVRVDSAEGNNYVVTRRERRLDNPVATGDHLMALSRVKTTSPYLLLPLAFEVDSQSCDCRAVLPLVGSERSICMDLLRFVYPSGPDTNPIPLSPQEVYSLVAHIAEALAVLKSSDALNGVVVEPANIFVEVKLVDPAVRQQRQVVRYLLADLGARRHPEDRSTATWSDPPTSCFTDVRRQMDATAEQRCVYGLGVTLFWLLSGNNGLRCSDQPGDARLVNDLDNDALRDLFRSWRLDEARLFDQGLVSLVASVMDTDPKQRPSIDRTAAILMTLSCAPR